MMVNPNFTLFLTPAKKRRGEKKVKKSGRKQMSINNFQAIVVRIYFPLPPCTSFPLAGNNHKHESGVSSYRGNCRYSVICLVCMELAVATFCEWVAHAAEERNGCNFF